MSTKTKAKENDRYAGYGLDDRMKRELAAHNQWVADCEKKRKTEPPRTTRAAKAVRKSPK